MSSRRELTEFVADLSEHVKYLSELGVDTWPVEIAQGLEANARYAVGPRAVAHGSAEPRPITPAVPQASSARGRERDRTAAVETPRRLRLADLPTLPKREPRPATMPPSSACQAAGAGSNDMMRQQNDPAAADETLEQIRDEIGDCTRCPLHALGRSRIVHSIGDSNARLMFVGEAPGADEDAQGIPFVGRAGQLLTKMIESIGFRREDVFIGNINRCRPPANRPPEPDEAAVCRPFLLREIAVVRPEVVVVLGATAAHNLLQVKTPISKLRGQFHDLLGFKVMPTFHPAYLLRDPNKKRDVWEDLKQVRDLLAASSK